MLRNAPSARRDVSNASTMKAVWRLRRSTTAKGGAEMRERAMWLFSQPITLKNSLFQKATVTSCDFLSCAKSSLAELMSSIIFWDAAPALKSMFLPSRFHSPHWKFLHPFKDWMLLSMIFIRGLSCKFVPFSSLVVGVLFKLPCLFWSWTKIHGVPQAWTFRSKLRFFPHLAAISHYLLSVLVRKLESRSLFAWAWLDVGRSLE